MNDSQISTLKAVLQTLDKISVRGSENMDMLLGCMQTINRMIAEAELMAEAKNRKEDE